MTTDRTEYLEAMRRARAEIMAALALCDSPVPATRIKHDVSPGLRDHVPAALNSLWEAGEIAVSSDRKVSLP